MTAAAALVTVLMAAPPALQEQAAAPPAVSEATAAERDRVLSQAESELQAGRRAEAKRLLESATERFGSVRVLLQLARLQAAEGDAPGALASLGRARALAPNAEEVLSATAQISLAVRAPVPAILVLEPLARMHPGTPEHHYLLGVALMQAGDMLSAIESLREAERLEPSRRLTLIALGIALNNRKMFDESKPVLASALDREPENLEAMAALAEAEEGLGDIDAADRYAARVLDRAPGHATALLVAGMVRMKTGRYEEARAALEKAAAADPDSPKAYYQLSLACARLGDSAGSTQHLNSYREKLRAMELRVEEIRKAGVAVGGGM